MFFFRMETFIHVCLMLSKISIYLRQITINKHELRQISLNKQELRQKKEAPLPNTFNTLSWLFSFK